MPDTAVFDIETYRPDWQVPRTRREGFDPERNTIITVGFFDGEEASISPTIEDLKDERKPVQFFLDGLEKLTDSVLVGYNILRFDIPYLVHKSKLTGEDLSISRFKPLDLYWVFPYWLHNTPNGAQFFRNASHLGNLWSFENIVKHILKEESNPFTNKDIFRLWEMRKFCDIEKHLKLDLLHTYSFFNSSVVQEALDDILNRKFDGSRCKHLCPFRQPLQKTPESAYCYCTLRCEIMSDESEMPAIDVIDQPLPERDASWIPSCLT